jgi:hypothetical protein
MPIDIDALTESELIDLNHRVVARLRFLAHMDAHATMLEFRIGDVSSGWAPAGNWYDLALQQENRQHRHRRWTPLECGAAVAAARGAPRARQAGRWQCDRDITEKQAFPIMTKLSRPPKVCLVEPSR